MKDSSTVSDLREQLRVVMHSISIARSDVDNPDFIRRSVRDEMRAVLVCMERLIGSLQRAHDPQGRLDELWQQAHTLKAKIVETINADKIAELLRLAALVKEE